MPGSHILFPGLVNHERTTNIYYCQKNSEYGAHTLTQSRVPTMSSSWQLPTILSFNCNCYCTQPASIRIFFHSEETGREWKRSPMHIPPPMSVPLGAHPKNAPPPSSQHRPHQPLAASQQATEHSSTSTPSRGQQDHFGDSDQALGAGIQLWTSPNRSALWMLAELECVVPTSLKGVEMKGKWKLPHRAQIGNFSPLHTLLYPSPRFSVLKLRLQPNRALCSSGLEDLFIILQMNLL